MHNGSIYPGKESAFNIPTVNIKATGENIVRLRKEAGLSVKDIQNACGFGTPQAVYKWQQGLALPTVDNLLVLSYLFGVTIDEIIIVDKEDWLALGTVLLP